MNEENKEVQVPNFESEEMKMPENNNVGEVAQEESSLITGPLLFTFVIVLVVILGGLFFWFTSINEVEIVPTPTERPTAEENNEPESTTAEAQTDTMLVTSTSDEIDAIVADIEATELEGLDAELEAIEAELDAALAL
jgi:cytoskeletal protein RodZ